MTMTGYRSVRLLILIGILASFTAYADTTYETVLVPIVLAQPAPGAYGSLWTSALHVFADGADLHFKQFDVCLACAPEYVVPANTTATLDIGLVPAVPSGRLIYLARDATTRAVFELRVSDLSRQSLTWGTELPVVREPSFRTDHVTLIAVPTDARFRVALRVYDVDAQPNSIFRVDMFDEAAGNLLQTAQFGVTPSPEPTSGRIPSTLELTDLRAMFPVITSAETVRVVVTPVNVSRFWAFVSVTNNETQHVTTITP